MAEAKTKRAVVARAFTDNNFGGGGEARSFVAGETVTLPEGAFANYEHAGLVSAPSDAPAKAKAKAPRRKTKRPAAKAAAPAPAPSPAPAAPPQDDATTE